MVSLFPGTAGEWGWGEGGTLEPGGGAHPSTEPPGRHIIPWGLLEENIQQA